MPHTASSFYTPPHAFKIRGGCEGGGKGYLGMDEQAFTVATGQDQFLAQPVAWDEELNARENMSGAVIRGGDGGRHAGVMQSDMAVRRLTPRECERLQGFPDDYTLIPVKCKPAADGPRYKAIGNSWAVPKFRWLGERIQMVEDLL